MTTATTLRCFEIRAHLLADGGQPVDCSTAEVIGDERYHPTQEAAEQCADECRDALEDAGLDPRTQYTVHEVVLDEAGAFAAARRWDDEQLAAAGWGRCESGEWSGQRCEMVVPAVRRVAMRWVPEANRETADRAGTWRGLSRVSHVCAGCAEEMAEIDGQWCAEEAN